MLVFATAWISTALAVYPPRGIDDVTYHLPPIYQAIQDHRLTVLPIELRGHFGYPLNAEMLFLLVPLFTGNIRWIAAPQAVFWIVGMLAVYALGRRSSLAPRGAALAAALFGAMPVCLLQTTTNYVDLISAAWLLSAVIALWHYEATGSRLALALGGTGVGLLAGTKVSTLTLCALIALAALGSCAAWFGRPGLGWPPRRCLPHRCSSRARNYVRDWIVLSNPFYPYPIRAFGQTIFEGTLEIGRNSWSAIVADPRGRACRIVGSRTRDVPRRLRLSLLGIRVPGRRAPLFATYGIGRPFGISLAAALSASIRHGDALPRRARRLFVFARLVLIVGAPVFIGYAVLVDETRGRLPGAGTILRALAIVAEDPRC